MSNYILNIETASKNCSVSLAQDGNVVELLEEKSDGFVHGEVLHLLIDKIKKKYQLSSGKVLAIAVGAGPGSYTGLRIGVATAKGLAYSWGCKMISVDTLQSMSCWAAEKVDEGILMPMIDARRMEVYTAQYSLEGEQIMPVSASIIDEEYLLPNTSHRITVFGDGAEKTLPILGNKLTFIDGIEPSAKYMAGLSYQKFLKDDFEDLAYYEPNYLKEFKAGMPKKIF